LATTQLAGLIEPLRHAISPHVWMPLGELDAERVAGLAMRAGVRVTAPAAPFPAGTPIDGLRLCLGPARDIASLERAFAVLKGALSPGRALSENVV
jgi:DNA-binding transcriptional MocR family regulator